MSAPNANRLSLDKSEWGLTRLGDLASDVNDRVANPEESEYGRFVGLEHFVSGDLLIKSWQTTDGLVSAAKVFRSGDILFARRNAYLKRASIVDFDGVCSGDAFVLRENHNAVVPGFLAFVVNSESLWRYAISNAAGTMSKRVKWRDLANYRFLLPPKKQQAKLAELLWAADLEGESLRTAEEALESAKDSIFKELTNKLDRKYEQKVSTLLRDGPTNGYSPKSSDDGTSYTVSIGAVKNGRFTPDGNLKRATVEETILEKFNVQNGDLFIVRGNGNRLLCGKAGLALKAEDNLFYPDLLIRLRFDPDLIDPEFAAYQWNHPSTHYRLLRWAKSTNGIWKINGADIKNHLLIVPPKAEQTEILGTVRSFEARLTTLRNTKHAATQLKETLINQIL